MNVKISVFVICVKAIINLLQYNLHACNFNAITQALLLNLQPPKRNRKSGNSKEECEGQLVFIELILTHSMPLISFYTPWKHQKTRCFLMFSGGIERDSSMKWVNSFISNLTHFKCQRCPHIGKSIYCFLYEGNTGT